MRAEKLVKIGQPMTHRRHTSSLESIPEYWLENPRPAPLPPGDYLDKPLPPLPQPYLHHKKSNSDELRREAILRSARQAEEKRLSLLAAAAYLRDLCQSFFEAD